MQDTNQKNKMKYILNMKIWKEVFKKMNNEY